MTGDYSHQNESRRIHFWTTVEVEIEITVFMPCSTRTVLWQPSSTKTVLPTFSLIALTPDHTIATSYTKAGTSLNLLEVHSPNNSLFLQHIVQTINLSRKSFPRAAIDQLPRFPFLHQPFNLQRINFRHLGAMWQHWHELMPLKSVDFLQKWALKCFARCLTFSDECGFVLTTTEIVSHWVYILSRNSMTLSKTEDHATSKLVMLPSIASTLSVHAQHRPAFVANRTFKITLWRYWVEISFQNFQGANRSACKVKAFETSSLYSWEIFPLRHEPNEIGRLYSRYSWNAGFIPNILLNLSAYWLALHTFATLTRRRASTGKRRVVNPGKWNPRDILLVWCQVPRRESTTEQIGKIARKLWALSIVQSCDCEKSVKRPKYKLRRQRQ